MACSVVAVSPACRAANFRDVFFFSSPSRCLLLVFADFWAEEDQHHGMFPCISRKDFPCFFGKAQGKTSKTQGLLIPTEPLKSLEKQGKTHKITRKILARKKTRHFQKQGRTGSRCCLEEPKRVPKQTGTKMPIFKV